MNNPQRSERQHTTALYQMKDQYQCRTKFIFALHWYNPALSYAAHKKLDKYSVKRLRQPQDSPDAPRNVGDSGQSHPAPGHRSQSERDWSYAKRALARGDDPQEVMRRIAEYRTEDKHDPLYYARLTVRKAQIDLKRETSEEVAKTGTQTPDQPPSERAILGRE